MDIDELKILEWCGFTNPRIDPWGFWLWDMADGGLFRGDKKDKPSHDMLYSLDWQAKYLWVGIKTPFSIDFDGEDYCCTVGFADNIELIVQHHKDPATAILKAVMELIK